MCYGSNPHFWKIMRVCECVTVLWVCVTESRPVSGRFSTAPNTVIWQAELAELAPVPLWLRTHGLWMTWSWLRHAESLTPCFSGYARMSLHIWMFAYVPVLGRSSANVWVVYCASVLWDQSVDNVDACICASKGPNSYLICKSIYIQSCMHWSYGHVLKWKWFEMVMNCCAAA